MNARAIGAGAVVLALAFGCAGCGDPDPPPAVIAEDTTAADAGRQPAPRMPVEEIAPGIAVLSGFSNGNVLAVQHAGGVVLVDAQSAERVGELAETLPAAGFTGPVTDVVNTHYHPDHVGGNPHFRAFGARIWAHASVPEEMGKEMYIEELDWNRVPEPEEARPTDLVDDTVELGDAGARIVVRHTPAAHTGGDLVVWLPDHGVLHMGDIVEIGADPLVDRWAGGTLDGMIEAVDWALSVAGPDTVIVPGHGPLIDRDALEAYRDKLAEEAARCNAGEPGLGCRD